METPTVSTIADTDIEAGVHHLMTQYPPLVKDRNAIKVNVKDGVVTLTGHTQTPITRRYFLDKMMPTLAGVKSVNAEGLFDEQSIRMEVARILPIGVQANIRYGTVILSGEVSSDVNTDELIAKVSSLPGVVNVMNDLNK